MSTYGTTQYALLVVHARKEQKKSLLIRLIALSMCEKKQFCVVFKMVQRYRG